MSRLRTQRFAPKVLQDRKEIWIFRAPRGRLASIAPALYRDDGTRPTEVGFGNPVDGVHTANLPFCSLFSSGVIDNWLPPLRSEFRKIVRTSDQEAHLLPIPQGSCR